MNEKLSCIAKVAELEQRREKIRNGFGDAGKTFQCEKIGGNAAKWVHAIGHGTPITFLSGCS
ncbi:hypothetical protein [Planctomycetes bacterium TBK1r]|uniref:hypothetical protein n=1 Tax=Stieleria magnilauensis TaxID=2527963 RepID=UPI0011A03BF9